MTDKPISGRPRYSTTWFEAAFRARITTRAEELQLSLRSVLLDAGLSPETLDKPPVGARRIETLERLAGALDWSLAEIMGLAPPSVDGETLELAFLAAERVTQLTRRPDLERRLFCQLAAGFYNTIATRRRDGQTVDSEVIELMAQAVAEVWRRSSR